MSKKLEISSPAPCTSNTFKTPPTFERRKIPVSERAVLARIRRYLARDLRGVTKNRAPHVNRYPEWIIINERSFIVGGFDDPEEFAREHGLLKPYEFMEKA